MKTSHLLVLVIVAVAIGVVVSTAGDASQYVTFAQAQEMVAAGNDQKVHIVGELKKDAQNQVVGIVYNPSEDPNYLSFVLVDDEKQERKVVCYNPPASMRDFHRSEKVVVIGKAAQGHFTASQILMKCPSKYQENGLQNKQLGI